MTHDKLPPTTPILPGLTLSDFWSWAYSDLNANRAAFADFLTAAALGLLDTPRTPASGYDLLYCERKIAVKAASSDTQRVEFDISERMTEQAVSASYQPAPRRVADCYVFCLPPVQPLDVGAWAFHVLSTKTINTHFGRQQKLSLNTLREHSPAVSYDALRQAIDRVLFPDTPTEQL